MEKNNMTVQQAINVVAEEAVRCRRLARDLMDPPSNEKLVEHAAELRKRADAMDKLVKIARLWNTPTDE